MDNKFKLLVSEFGEERIKFNEPLKFHTATKLGGLFYRHFYKRTGENFEQRL